MLFHSYVVIICISFLFIGGLHSIETEVIKFMKTPHFGKNPFAKINFKNALVSKVRFCIDIKLYFRYYKAGG